MREIRGCFKGVSKMFQGSINGVIRNFKDVSRKFQGCFMEGSRKVFQNNLKDVSRKIKKLFNIDLRVLQWSFKDI